jgi:hypothetical protein
MAKSPMVFLESTGEKAYVLWNLKGRRSRGVSRIRDCPKDGKARVPIEIYGGERDGKIEWPETKDILLG